MDGKLVIWRAFYGQKSEIAKYLARLQEAGLHRVYRSFDQALEPNEPACVADVTLGVRFSLDSTVPGLFIPKMQTKQNLLGFYNPIPPFKREYENPVLCLVYTLGEPLLEGFNADLAAKPPQNLHIDYFNDRQEVKIIVPPQ